MQIMKFLIMYFSQLPLIFSEIRDLNYVKITTKVYEIHNRKVRIIGPNHNSNSTWNKFHYFL